MNMIRMLAAALAVICFSSASYALDIYEKSCGDLPYADETLVKQLVTGPTGTCDNAYPGEIYDTWIGAAVRLGANRPASRIYAIVPTAREEGRKPELYVRQWSPDKTRFTELPLTIGDRGDRIRDKTLGRVVDCYTRTVSFASVNAEGIHFNDLYPLGQARADRICANVLANAKK